MVRGVRGRGLGARGCAKTQTREIFLEAQSGGRPITVLPGTSARPARPPPPTPAPHHIARKYRRRAAPLPGTRGARRRKRARGSAGTFFPGVACGHVWAGAPSGEGLRPSDRLPNHVPGLPNRVPGLPNHGPTVLAGVEDPTFPHGRMAPQRDREVPRGECARHQNAVSTAPTAPQEAWWLKWTASRECRHLFFRGRLRPRLGWSPLWGGPSALRPTPKAFMVRHT